MCRVPDNPSKSSSLDGELDVPFVQLKDQVGSVGRPMRGIESDPLFQNIQGGARVGGYLKRVRFHL
jgi:hypothetical protein